MPTTRDRKRKNRARFIRKTNRTRKVSRGMRIEFSSRKLHFAQFRTDWFQREFLLRTRQFEIGAFNYARRFLKATAVIRSKFDCEIE